MDEKYIGTARAAEMLGVKRDTMSRWCREGKFKTARQDKVGSPWIILEEEVLEFARREGKTA